MPTWKKVIVSGSNAHLTSITASQVPTGTTENVLLISTTGEVKQVSQATLTGTSVLSFVTMSVGGLGGSSGTVVADSAVDNLTISSADVNITINANSGSDTLTFDFADSPSFTHITASGNISGSGNLSITGTSTLTGRLNANGAITTTNITASGTISGSGNIFITGNGTIGGTLDVTGTTTLAGNLLANGNTTLGNANTDTVTITAATVTAANLPTYTAGTHNDVLIQSASSIIAKREIDVRVWGSSLLDGSLTATRVPFATDANSLTDSANLTFAGNILTVNGSTFGQDVAIAGNLTVSGTTTVIDTTNLSVEDKFIILAHGSGSISPIQEGGIIIEGSTADSGQAFVFNSGSTANVTGRWGIAANVHATSSDVTPTEFMVSAITTGAVPSTAPTYGGSNGGYGNIHVNSTDESIWIYS
jgi:hypothetical protein